MDEANGKPKRRKPRICMCDKDHQRIVFEGLGEEECPLCLLLARVSRTVGKLEKPLMQ